VTIAKEAEEYIKEYFKEKRKIELVKLGRGERGFDFRDTKSEIFIEVKGTGAKRLSDVLFRYFTNAEYEKAKECLRNNKQYEVHLILGIGTESVEHYCIPAKVFIERAKPEVIWSLPNTEGDSGVPSKGLLTTSLTNWRKCGAVSPR